MSISENKKKLININLLKVCRYPYQIKSLLSINVSNYYSAKLTFPVAIAKSRIITETRFDSVIVPDQHEIFFSR